MVVRIFFSFLTHKAKNTHKLTSFTLKKRLYVCLLDKHQDLKMELVWRLVAFGSSEALLTWQFWRHMTVADLKICLLQQFCESATTASWRLTTTAVFVKIKYYLKSMFRMIKSCRCRVFNPDKLNKLIYTQHTHCISSCDLWNLKVFTGIVEQLINHKLGIILARLSFN